MKRQSSENSLLKVFGLTPRIVVVVVLFLIISGIFLGLLVQSSGFVGKKIPLYKKNKQSQIVQPNKVELLSSEEDNVASVMEVVESDVVNENSEVVSLPKEKTLFDINKLPFSKKNENPVVAIIIDDMGIDLIHTQQILDFENIYTVSYLTYAPNLQAQIDVARARGKEVLLHVPMESVHRIFDYGPEVLLTTMSRAENLKVLSAMLNRVSGYIGINNHMGSKFTSDFPLLSAVMEELSMRGLMFLDSKTTPKSQAGKIAEHIKLPFVSRDIFVDDSNKIEDIEKSLYRTELLVKKYGYGVVIAHPRINTINAFKRWLPTLEAKGIQVVPVSYIVDNFKK